MRKFISFLAKLSISIIILFLILRSIPVQDYAHAWKLFSAKILISLLFLVAIQVCILAVRWYLLAKSEGSSITIASSIFGILMSFFFTQGLPASVGADAFRIWWHRREGMASSTALKIIFYDRIFGMLSLIILCLLSFSLLSYFYIGKEKLITLISSCLIIGGLFVLLIIPRRFGFSQKMMDYSSKLPFFLPKIIRAIVKMRNLFCQKSFFTILLLLTTGITIHLLATIQVYIVGHQLNSSLSFIGCLAAVPTALFISYMPFSIAGWGVREASMVATLGLIGINASTAIFTSITIGMTILFVALLGGIIWFSLGFKKSYQKSSMVFPSHLRQSQINTEP